VPPGKWCKSTTFRQPWQTATKSRPDFEFFLLGVSALD